MKRCSAHLDKGRRIQIHRVNASYCQKQCRQQNAQEIWQCLLAAEGASLASESELSALTKLSEGWAPGSFVEVRPLLWLLLLVLLVLMSHTQ